MVCLHDFIFSVVWLQTMSTGCLHVVLSNADQIRRISWKVLLEQLWRRCFARGSAMIESMRQCRGA